jgi:hypothetical protein
MAKKGISFMLLIFLSLFGSPALATENNENDVSIFLQQLFESRAKLLINQEPNSILRFYSSTSRTSQHAFQMETRRASYINAWANERGIELVKASNEILRSRIRVKGNDAKALVVNSLRMDYAYRNKNLQPQSFGIGTRHSLTLKKINNQWCVLNDWYSDPMEDDPKEIPTQRPGSFAANYTTKPKLVEPFHKHIKYNRIKAVTYADKYAGSAWGAGNNHFYNPKYPDYHYEGGDCTNFASQVLADPLEGGGLRMTNAWRANRQAGTVAWVQTDSFKRFLIYSGYGRLIAAGTYRQLVSPTTRYPEGAISQLEPGDLIGYIMKNNDIDHFSVVVGRDSNGYPLVNSHTGDRYHVPWDIGWDKYTKFVLIHIND